MEPSASFRSVQTFNSALTPDCAKFCPISGFGQYVVIAFYELREGQIYGALQLHEIVAGQLIMRHDLKTTAGILDFQWFNSAIDGDAYFCTAGSDSCVNIYLLDVKSSESSQLVEVGSVETESPMKCLYIDVNLSSLPTIHIVVSTDQESVFRIAMNRTTRTEFNVIDTTTKISNHQFSVWACAISPSDTNVFLSGGDDQKLLQYDLRVPDYQVAVNKRTHEMGITTINFDPLDSNTFFTGCYDEHLRVWDVRKIGREVLSSKREGGVWRAVWKPSSSKQALIGVYCQKYFEIVDLDTVTSSVNQVEKLNGHDSLAYSCDWSQDTKHIITCSFYDKLVQFWEQH